MINLQTVVYIILYLLGAGVVFGLLYWMILYVEKEFPGFSPFFKVARIVLVVLAVLVLIGLVISFLGGESIFYWGSSRPVQVR